MSGKAYTLQEMRSIVEYLTEHRAYSEIKGRKFWMFFANSQMTNRTWQSLKETFLKRILPDIHNPYYRLTMDQMRSFKQGYDLEKRANNKLEIHTISDDSSNAENANANDNAQPSTSNNDNNEDKTSGENKKCSQITSRNSSSADTYIVEKCYDTAEEIQRDLESPTLNKIVSKANEASDDLQKPTVKSLRDFITYSEPLTPMLQELLDDFASEDESDREPRMEIAEDVTPDIESQSIIDKSSNVPTDTPNTETVTKSSEEIKIQSPSKSTTVEDPSNGKKDGQLSAEVIIVKTSENDIAENNKVDSIVSADNSKQMEKDVTEEIMPNSKPQENEMQTIAINDTDNDIAHSEVSPVAVAGTLKKAGDISKTNEIVTQSCSHSTNDSILPNNPEAFDKSPIINKKTVKQNGHAKGLSDIEMDKNITSRKRSNLKDEDCPESKKSKQGCNNDIEKKQDRTSIDEINSVAENSNENTYIKQSSNIEEINLTEPSTRNVDKTTNENEIVEHVKDDEDEEIINPCLKSVSLYAEQSNTSKYVETDSDVEIAVTNSLVDKKKQDSAKNNDLVILKSHSESESDHKELPVKIPKSATCVSTKVKKDCRSLLDKKKQDSAKTNDVVILKSHSESESDHKELPVKIPKSATCVSTKVKKDRALANMFGFSTGMVTKNRKKLSSYKKSTGHHYDRNSNSFDSSEWTSENDSEEYVSAPRGHKKRHNRKYIKPQFSRVVSLEEEGALFVMNGDKIYPLVKDGKAVKNYLKYLPDSDNEEDESYWKLKYVEERKRTEELKKMIEQLSTEQIRKSESPILQQTTSRIHTANLKRHSVLNVTTNKDEATETVEPKTNEVENKQENIKLKFTINNEEVQLEGQWTNINPVFEKVIQVFNSNNNKESKQANDSNCKAVQAELKPDGNSGTCTPIIVSRDPLIREKVDQIEKEIFKEIEDRDKEETNDEKETKPLNGEDRENENDQENNVTTRKAKGKSIIDTPVSSPQTPPKVTEKKVPDRSVKKRRLNELENIKMTDSPKRQTNSPQNLLNDSPKKETRSLRTRKSTVKETASRSFVDEDNPDIRYKFAPKKNIRVSASKSEKLNEKKSNKSKENVETFLSPDSLSRNSIESSQGYQDSDINLFMDTQAKRKKKFGLSLQHRNSQQFHRNMRRRSTSCLPRFLNSYSTNSTFSAPIQKLTNDNSSLNTEVYRSESYQLLLPKPQICIKRLEIIDEVSSSFNLKDQINKKLLHSVNKDVNENITKINNDTIDSNQGSMEAGSSSNVSLPLSPELSIVENLSLSKSMMNNVEDPTINETQANYIPDSGSYQKYLISELDISVPLMEQECGLKENSKAIESNNTLKDPKAIEVTDSFLNKIGTVKINENSTLLHSLDQRLQELLLESAKKILPPTEDLQNKNNSMEVDVSNNKPTVKAKGRKRCSTPRKKKGTNKPKIPKIGPVIEEEHMELCSHGGRKSCPPYIDVRPTEETAINFDETFFERTNVQKIAPDKLTKKNKKDIIKVKILRPRDKNRTKANNDKKKSSEDHTKMSVNDSGLNDTGLGISFTMLHDSIDLIHNHSETCLQVHECFDNSVEFIENSSKSIISIDSNSMQLGDNLWQNEYKQFSDAQDIPSDVIFNNNLDSTQFNRGTGLDSPDGQFVTPCETVYHSPIATENTSLITEDLSDEISGGYQHPEESTKWYLLSDDETNTMGLQLPNGDFQFPSSGANLNELFPIACAVPDLSTITEMSRDNDDNSRKPTLMDEDTRNDFDRTSIFSS